MQETLNDNFCPENTSPKLYQRDYRYVGRCGRASLVTLRGQRRPSLKVLKAICAGNACVSRPGGARDFRAKTRKHENVKTARKTQKRENAKTPTEVRKRESWTAISGLTARQCNIIILRCNSSLDLCCAGTSGTE